MDRGLRQTSVGFNKFRLGDGTYATWARDTAWIPHRSGDPDKAGNAMSYADALQNKRCHYQVGLLLGGVIIPGSSSGDAAEGRGTLRICDSVEAICCRYTGELIRLFSSMPFW